MVKPTRSTDLKTSVTDTALANYLDAMLHSATETDDARWPDTEPEPGGELTATDSAGESLTADHKAVAELAPAPVVSVPQPAEPAHTTTALAEPKTAEPAEPVRSSTDAPGADAPQVTTPESDSADADLSRWLDNGRPVWAQQRFDCLVFVVDGLKLAVPLILLGNIHPLDRDLTPLFDQPDWFLGLLPVQNGRNLRVVDTARLVMPERYRPQSVEELAFAVGVYGSDWAFGCHQIEGSISLEPEAVKWRSTRTSRPWLAGTVIDRMCALVDLHEFASTAFRAPGA